MTYAIFTSAALKRDRSYSSSPSSYVEGDHWSFIINLRLHLLTSFSAQKFWSFTTDSLQPPSPHIVQRVKYNLSIWVWYTYIIWIWCMYIAQSMRAQTCKSWNRELWYSSQILWPSWISQMFMRTLQWFYQGQVIYVNVHHSDRDAIHVNIDRSKRSSGNGVDQGTLPARTCSIWASLCF